jgi:hypothetical protein
LAVEAALGKTQELFSAAAAGLMQIRLLLEVLFMAAAAAGAATQQPRLAGYLYSAGQAVLAAMQAHCPRQGKPLLAAAAAVKTQTQVTARGAKSAYGLRGDRYVKPQSPNH